ncbi:MAG: dephospho-CoA kinase [Bifidobacterium sp.]|jgi:dephospho-CoA kinase|nr:dephospho-CoA kinase [Bifidobacterium sp.]
MLRIALTGGIAAGKSTVAQHLKAQGLTLIDYDALARQVVAPGSAGLCAIVREFGPQAIDVDGKLDRAWLAGQVFGEHAAPGARERLGAIEHPLIYEAAKGIEQSLANENNEGDDAGSGGAGVKGEIRGNDAALHAIVVHDVPLLAEVIGTMPFSFAHIVSVEAPEDVRIARMIDGRGMSRAQAMARIRYQSSETERRALADVIIDSTQPVERMFECVDTLVAQWRHELSS